MRFDCGEEKSEQVARLSVWHRFYPIFPRKVAPHDCRWFEWIEWRGKHYDFGVDDMWIWEYRAIAPPAPPERHD